MDYSLFLIILEVPVAHSDSHLESSSVDDIKLVSSDIDLSNSVGPTTKDQYMAPNFANPFAGFESTNTQLINSQGFVQNTVKN